MEINRYLAPILYKKCQEKINEIENNTWDGDLYIHAKLQGVRCLRDIAIQEIKYGITLHVNEEKESTQINNALQACTREIARLKRVGNSGNRFIEMGKEVVIQVFEDVLKELEEKGV